MKSRILTLKDQSRDNAKSIVYIMSRDQRVKDNHALLAAQTEALEQKLPLIVAFVLLPKTGFRKREHFQFMIDGLRNVEKDLKKKNISFCMRSGTATSEIVKIANDFQPRSLYFDFSPLNGPRVTQKKVADSIDCSAFVIDTHNIIPTWVASDKEEFAAHTFRRKVHKQLEAWCVEPDELKRHPHDFSAKISSLSWKDVDKLVSKIPKSGVMYNFESGEAAAREQLSTFLEDGLVDYAANRNDAAVDAQSNLSPYLHYGQLSSLRVMLESLKKSAEPPLLFRYVKMPNFEEAPTEQDGIDALLEELIVRKELSDNFCFYQSNYMSIDGAREWAKKSLAKHEDDPRDFIYPLKQLNEATTHDNLWNAAQNQLRQSGKIHGYMRMYWAKKILEWTESPAKAIEIAIELNDTYTLDGGDPNGYVGILWSIAGLHDRAWFERSVYGKIRYMNANGAAKKFNSKKYIEQWQNK